MGQPLRRTLERQNVGAGERHNSSAIIWGLEKGFAKARTHLEDGRQEALSVEDRSLAVTVSPESMQWRAQGIGGRPEVAIVVIPLAGSCLFLATAGWWSVFQHSCHMIDTASVFLRRPMLAQKISRERAAKLKC